MAHQADPVRIDVGPALQIGDARQNIGREILGRGVSHVAGRAAHASIVDPQYGNAAACQVVGNHEEGAMSEDRFVAVLLAGSRDEQHGRKRSAGPRKRQRAGEFRPGGGVCIVTFSAL